MTVAILVVPSVTKLPPEADGAVVVGGSHAAVYAAHLVAKAGARAAIHHDAGIGLDEAGVGGLAFAEELGMAMAAVATESARIGEGEDLMRRGVVSRVNALAAACGVAPGQTCAEAAERLKAAPWPHRAPPAKAEGRSVFEAKAGRRRIVCIDSATLITAEDHDQVVATGSHGARVGPGGGPGAARPGALSTTQASAPTVQARPACPFSTMPALPAPRWRRCRQRSAMAARPSPRASCPR